MIQQVIRSKPTASRWNWLHKTGGVTALVTGILLLLGMISLIFSRFQPGTANGWLLPFQNNWLIKIFVLHAGFSGVQADLYGLNLLDIVILLLVSMMCLGLSTAFQKAGKTWSIFAFALSLIAILLFVITQIAGRSTVMLAVLINSLVMWKDKTFSKVMIYMGILASISLFAGDLTVGIRSNIVTTLFGIGYVLLMTWFFLVAQHIFGQVSSNGDDSRWAA